MCTVVFVLFFFFFFPFLKKHVLPKSVVKYYTKQKSFVYMHAFLMYPRHLTECHWTLFGKLIKRNIPLVIVRIVAFWYQTQPMCIRQGKIAQHISMFQMVYARAGCYRLKGLLFMLMICH